MNKPELIKALEDASGQSKSACEAVIDALPDVLLETMRKGDSVTLPRFVKIEARKREPREVRNPATGASMSKPAQMVPGVKPTKPFKDAVAEMPVRD